MTLKPRNVFMEADSGGSQSPPRAVELDGKVRYEMLNQTAPNQIALNWNM
jgi:hypothetical protein